MGHEVICIGICIPKVNKPDFEIGPITMFFNVKYFRKLIL